MNNLNKYGLYIGIAAVGILLGAMMFGGNETKVEHQTTDEHIAENHTDDDGNIIYTCSMHPSVRQNEPGDCPICGMELLPANDNTSAEGDPNELTMSLAAMKLAEIETSIVRSGNPVSTIYLPGKVVADQNKVSSITSHAAGRIINLYVDYEGAFIKKGQKIASIYSPELISAQQEFLQTVEFKSQNPMLYTSAKRKLELLELPSSTIENLEVSGELMTEIDIVSQATGYVTRLNVSRQEHIVRGSILFEVADLSDVWVMLDAYESDLSLIEKGQTIKFTTTTYPGEEFEGTVSFIDPTVNRMTRTADVRIKAKNPNQNLKPNMLAEGILTAEISNESSLMIPKSAVLWTGPRSIVFVQLPNTATPTFIAREVTLGKRIGNQYIILEGLNFGEEVVTHGNFKLDGAAQLSDKLSMMNRNPDTEANRTGHEGHIMDAVNSGEMVRESNSSSINNEAAETSEEDHSEHQSMNSEVNINSTPDKFKTQLNEVVQEYLKLKDALVESNSSAVALSAKEIQKALNTVDMSLVKGNMNVSWMNHFNQMNNILSTLASSSTLDNQRSSFLSLSNTLIESVKTFGLPGMIYQQFCPMTDGGKGAYWLSDSEEIANPYFGDQMHNCGEIITKIES